MSAPTPLQRLRQAHAALAPLALLPLLVTALSGMSYRLLRDGAGLGRDQAHRLMVIHEGEWLKPLLGDGAETIYVLMNGLGLLWMLISGAAMLSQTLRRQWQRRQS
ncbi:MAG: peptidase [Cyanobacteriota bacterium]